MTSFFQRFTQGVLGRVADRVGVHGGVQEIRGGFRFIQGEDATELTFEALTGGNGEVTLVIASVVTRFAQGSVPDFEPERLAYLNRRALYGAFFQEDDRLGCRLSLSFREQELDAIWIADHLFEALIRQHAFASGIAKAEVSKQAFLAARAELAVPRRWRRPVPETAFREIADALAAEGWEAHADGDDLSISVPLDDRDVRSGGDAVRLRITTGMEHPLAGVGYLALLVMPPLRRWWPGDLQSLALNQYEHEQEELPPRLGAWGPRSSGFELVYAFFLPADEGSAEVVRRITRWMIERAEWIRDELWVPEFGLSFPRVAA